MGRGSLCPVATLRSVVDLFMSSLRRLGAVWIKSTLALLPRASCRDSNLLCGREAARQGGGGLALALRLGDVDVSPPVAGVS